MSNRKEPYQTMTDNQGRTDDVGDVARDHQSQQSGQTRRGRNPRPNNAGRVESIGNTAVKYQQPPWAEQPPEDSVHQWPAGTLRRSNGVRKTSAPEVNRKQTVRDMAESRNTQYFQDFRSNRKNK